MSQTGRVLALDVGDVRIGVAVTDPTRTIAQPVEVYRRIGYGPDGAHIVALCEQYGTRDVLLGLPLNMDGTEGPRAQSSRAFARNLERIRPVNVAFQDERLSTTAVERFLIDELDLTRKRRADVVDRTAAAWILQGALDRLRA